MKTFLPTISLALLAGLGGTSCYEENGSIESGPGILEISFQPTDSSLFEAGADWEALKTTLTACGGYFEVGSRFVCLISSEGIVLKTDYAFEVAFEEWITKNSVVETVHWINGSPMVLGDEDLELGPTENQPSSVEEIRGMIHNLHDVITIVHPDFVEVRSRGSESE